MSQEIRPITPAEVQKVNKNDIIWMNEKLKESFVDGFAVIKTRYPLKVQLKPFYEEAGWTIEVVSPTVWIFSSDNTKL